MEEMERAVVLLNPKGFPEPDIGSYSDGFVISWNFGGGDYLVLPISHRQLKIAFASVAIGIRCAIEKAGERGYHTPT